MLKVLEKHVGLNGSSSCFVSELLSTNFSKIPVSNSMKLSSAILELFHVYRQKEQFE
jgi:hypothetical protein